MHPFKLRLPTLITAVIALALLAVAIDWSTPTGVALAQDIAVPKGLTATSGDGTMKVSWGSANGATGGYRYRYTDELLYTISGEGNVSEWFDHGSKKGDNSVTISAGTLTVGNTYYFQVRGKDTRMNCCIPSAVKATCPNGSTTAVKRETTPLPSRRAP